MELQFQYRRYQPLFYGSFYSLHAELPNFLINTHTVQDASDMRAYNARLRAIPSVLDAAIAERRASDPQGIRAPKFEIGRVIKGSKLIIDGAPFDAGQDSPLWSDAKAKIAKLSATKKISQPEAAVLLADSRASLLS